MKIQYTALSFILLSMALIQCQSDKKETKVETSTTSTTLRAPAEFEATEAVWLLWPGLDHKKELSNNAVTQTLINTIAPYAKVNLVVPNDSVMQAAMKLIPYQLIEGGKLSIIKQPYKEFWARDMGPSFVINQKGEMMMVDFNFNAWGYSDTLDELTRRDESLDERLAKNLQLPIISTNLIHEGGDHESNGLGTLIIVEAVEMGRNPNMSKTQIEAEFKRVLGVQKVIWLKEGLHEDDHTFRGKVAGLDAKRYYTLVTTNGHIDEFCRFVDAHTLLLGEVPLDERNTPLGRENHRRMEENYAILKAATDQNGQAFKVVRIPLPVPMIGTMSPGDGVYDQYLSTMDYADGTIFPKGKTVDVIAAASYLNFTIVNDLVIGQRYWKPGLPDKIRQTDAEALRILQSVMPQKKIVMLDALAINYGGGGIHCITMNQPKAVQKK